MIKVIVFDVDNTLYDELDYIRSGLRHVAEYLCERFAWSQAELERQLLQSLAVSRENIINRVLTQKGVLTKQLLNECGHVFRSHQPSIRMSNFTKRQLKTLALQHAIYVVIQGNSAVQKNKLMILGLSTNSSIQDCFILESYQQQLANYCHEITQRSNCTANELLLITANKVEEFVAFKALGYQLCRINSEANSAGAEKTKYKNELVVNSLKNALSGINRL